VPHNAAEQEENQMRRRIAIALAAAVIVSTAVAAAAAAKNGPLGGGLTAVRAAVARYNDIGQAVRAGYSLAGEPCVSSPDGAMGIHAVNFGLTADLANDPLRPEILLYLERNGRYELVGVEYWTIALANTESGPAPWFGETAPPLGFFNAAPSLFGHTFDGPMAGHNPQMPWHYDLHVWVFEQNPAGTFAPFNPAIAC
jgi:hypothetical protein